MSTAPVPAVRQQDRLKSLATGPRLLALLLACLVAAAMFEIRAAVTRLGAARPTVEAVPDARDDYDPGDLRAYFRAIGPSGRTLYINTQRTLDVFFPLVYGALLIGVIARLVPGRSRWLWWVWIPAAVVLADFGENLLLMSLADRFADAETPEWAATAVTASYFTAAKWLLVKVYYGLFFAALLWRGIASFGQPDPWRSA